MSLVIQGNNLSGGLQLIPDRNKLGMSKLGLVATRVYYILTSQLVAALPQYGAAHPVYSGLYLERWEGVQIENGTIQIVTENYRQWDFIIGTPVPPPDILPQAKSVEKDIRQHVNFYGPGGTPSSPTSPNWSQYWDDVNNQFYVNTPPGGLPSGKSLAPPQLRGVTSYIVGSGTISYTTYVDTEPSEATLRQQIGTLIDAPGQGLSGHWLVRDASVSRHKPWWGFTVVFQFSDTAWPTDIYGAGSSPSFGSIGNADYLGSPGAASLFYGGLINR